MGQPKAVIEDFTEVTTDELAPGHELMQGHYTIESFVGAGGFGITYLARNSLDRKVIIKECFPGSLCRRTASSVRARSSGHIDEFSSIVSKFMNEAHNLAKVKHPNIVGVHQVFEENKTAYMALDFVEGCDLLDVVEGKEDKPSPKQIEDILKKVLSAVGAIHEQDMLHRDISPDNIMLTKDMEPILIDFGAAREDMGQETRKLSEMRVIKDGYSPQEFYVSGAVQGPCSDLYALAATFYHLITGELPIDSQRRLAAVAASEDDPYVPIAGRVSEYSAAFVQGIDTAMAILPKDRFETADHWLDLLQGTNTATAAAAPVKSKEAIPFKADPKSQVSSKAKARWLGGIGLAIPVFGAVYMLQSNTNSPAVEETAAPSAIAEPVQLTADANPTADVASEAADPAADLNTLLNLTTATASAEATEVPSPEALGLVLPDASETVSTQAQEGATPETSDALSLEALELAVSGTAATGAPEDTRAATNPDLSDSLSLEALEQASILNLPLAADGDPATTAPVAEVEVASASIVIPQETETLEPSVGPEPQAVAFVPPTDVLVERFDLPQVTSAWSVDLTDAFSDASGQIYAINGAPFENRSEIEADLHQMMNAPEGRTVELSMLTGASKDKALVETVAVPVTHLTSFPDGTAFETRTVDGVWATVVANVPTGSNFQIGDVLVGELGSEILFDKRTSLPDILVDANTQGLERLTLVVRRDFELSVTSMLVPR